MPGKVNVDVEKILLVIFFAVFLFIGVGVLFDNHLKHDFPYAYLASDAFQHQTRAESIKDAGNYKNEASYIVMGLKGAIGYYPPVLYHLSAIFSELAGIEVYDSIYFLVFLFAAFGALLMYAVIRQFNKNAALISLPVSLLVFSAGLYSGFTWGHWTAITSQFFLVGVIWFTSRINLKKSFIFLAIFLSGSIMTHTSEALFAIIYIALFLAASMIMNTRKDSGLVEDTSAQKNYKKIFLNFYGSRFGVLMPIILGLLACLAISFYYLVIFRLVWIPRQPYEFSVLGRWDNPTMYLSDFKALLAFLGAGIVFSMIFLRRYLVPAIASFSMIVLGMGNYFGFREKAFQLRFFWPILLMFFIGTGVYHILNLVIKKWKIAYSAAIFALITLLILIGVPYMPHYDRIKTSGLMDEYHWEVFRWIEKKTQKDSRIYFFYGDIFNQDAVLRNSKRTHNLIIPEDFVDAINKREIRRIYDTEVPGDGGGGAPYRKSFFSFGFMLNEVPQDYLSGKKDICNFDYFVFDKKSRQQVLAQYNILIADELKKNGAVLVFENPVSIIMKNNKLGADCIEQRNF